MAKKAEMVRRIKNLQGQMNQAAFARYLGVPQSRISEYLAGKRPTAEMCVRLAKLAPYPDNLWFLEQAGLKRDDILSLAGNIARDFFTPPQGVEGEIVRVPEFRETFEGREEPGPPIALPARFIPHPLNTICLSVDEKSATVVDVPRGMFIVDTSIQGVEALSGLWGRVVMLRYKSKADDFPEYPDGLYAGRPQLEVRYAGGTNLMSSAWLEMLGQDIGTYRLPLAAHIYTDALTRGMGREDANRRVSEVKEQAKAEVRLREGIYILGKVIGRLTGHLEAPGA